MLRGSMAQQKLLFTSSVLFSDALSKEGGDEHEPNGVIIVNDGGS